MTRARDLSKLINPSALSIDSDNDVGIGSTQPTTKLDVTGDITVSGKYYGDGSSLTGVSAGVGTTTVSTDSLVVSGISTFKGDVQFEGPNAGVTSALWDSSAYLLNFKDNTKATFGDGNDLEIYHNGSNSIINDNGTGDLILQQGGNNKLKVTSTGIEVTGSIVGIASTATQVTVTTDAQNNNYKVPFTDTTANTTGNYDLLQDSGSTFTYNPSSNTLVAGNFSGNGSSLTALNASNVTSGTLAIARGGTNATTTPTQGAVAYGNGTAYAFSAAGSASQVLLSGGTGSPTWSNQSALSVGSATNVTITNDTSTNSTHYLHYGSATSGNDGVQVSNTNLTFNPSKGNVGFRTTPPTLTNVEINNRASIYNPKQSGFGDRLVVGYNTSFYVGAALTSGDGPERRNVIEAVGFGSTGARMALVGFSTNYAPLQYFLRSNSDSVGTYTSLTAGDILGAIIFYGSDGEKFVAGATIESGVAEDVTQPGGLKGYLDLKTSGGNPSFPYTTTSRIRILEAGNVGVGKTDPTEKLDVNGNVKADSFILSNGNTVGITTFDIESAPQSSIQFSGISTGFQRITIMFNELGISATAGAEEIGVRLGDGSTLLSSGYTSRSETLYGGLGASKASATEFAIYSADMAPNQKLSGTMVINKFSDTCFVASHNLIDISNNWIITGTGIITDTSSVGSISRIRIRTSDTFARGSVRIIVE